ncbi:hypothetical protein [Novipirellula artificiosorum]|nr:hypothetical protein [Novipirellula artificiosorum]
MSLSQQPDEQTTELLTIWQSMDDAAKGDLLNVAKGIASNRGDRDQR